MRIEPHVLVHGVTATILLAHEKPAARFSNGMRTRACQRWFRARSIARPITARCRSRDLPVKGGRRIE
jgi:hypothetical protein